MTFASPRLLLKCLAATSAALVLTACGNSGSSTTTTTTSSLTTADFTGSFVFAVNGTDPNDGDYTIAGTFTADGKGNISSGVADYNLGSGPDTNVPLTGTYTTSNGIATVNLTDGGSVQESYFVPIVKTGTATLTRYDGTGSGTLYAAAPIASAATGTYVASLTGQGDNTVAASANFTTVAGGTYTGGSETYTDGNNVMSYTNSGFLYPVKPNGRGQAAIGGNTFSYYMASASQVVLIGLDDRSLLKGTATKQ